MHAPNVVHAAPVPAPRPAPVTAAHPAPPTFAATTTSRAPAPTPARPARGWTSYGYGHPIYYSYVPVLPAYATLLWWNSVPYYTADNTYYVWNDGAAQYQVVPPPANVSVDPDPAPAPATPVAQVYTYPAAGQSAEQQQLDRYECYRWAVGQTGFDPSRGPDGVPPEAFAQAQSAYQRAELACLLGRGYRTQ